MIKIVQTDKAPVPVGPYSQGVMVDGLLCENGLHCGFLFISGMVPIDPSTGEPVKGSIQDQARRCLLNLKAIVEAAGGSLNDIVKVTVFLRDIKNFDDFNKVYSEFFGIYKPARSVVEAKPPRGFEVEVEAVAFVELKA